MAHVTHFKKSDVKKLVNEYDRDEKYMKTKDVSRIDLERVKDDYVLSQNELCPKRSLEDYRLHARPLLNKIESRLQSDDLKVSNRKDLNVMSTWVVTCPEELLDNPQDVERFFKTTYDYTVDRYGSENVLEGFVHMDETTPHMHIPIIPVADGRVSSKALFTKSELKGYQQELDKLCEKEFGKKGLILNGRTKGNYTVSELKERDKQKKALDDRENALNVRERDLERREQQLLAKEEIEAKIANFDVRLQSLEETAERIKSEKLKKAVEQGKAINKALADGIGVSHKDSDNSLSYS